MSDKSVASNFTQEVTLPSNGYMNPEIPEGKLIQRCMMVKDQKYLSGSNRDANDALQHLIEQTITEPENFDASKLTVADTLYLLFKLRVLSYGSMYKFRTKCPECGKKIDVSIDLSELPVVTLDSGYEESLKVTLPNRKDTVYTKIITNADNKELNEEIKRRKRRNPDDESAYILRIVYSIDKIKLVDGKELTHPIDIERYIESLTDMDAAAILSARDSVAFGTMPTVEYICPECREYIDLSVQFSGDFFRPSFNK